MLRGLGLRGSNSVCGRFIQRDSQPKLPSSNSKDLLFDEASPIKIKDSNTKEFNVNMPKRRTVKVLDLKESSKSNKDVYINFKKRLHPWTTIKVGIEFYKILFNLHFYFKKKAYRTGYFQIFIER